MVERKKTLFRKLKQKTKIQLVFLNEDSVSNYRFPHKDSLILTLFLRIQQQKIT